MLCDTSVANESLQQLQLKPTNFKRQLLLFITQFHYVAGIAGKFGNI